MDTVLSLTETPLKSLTVSPLNVRKTNLDEDIKALAADIHAHGLKQNLVVVPSPVAGRFEVVAGGRRLHALFHLVDQGLLSFETPIPVRVEAREEGRPTSLSENLHRVAMNPADEFIAFRTIVEEHADEPDPVAYCAGRFGVSRAHVEGRLRLASLAPEILDALRRAENRLPVEAAKAYAGIADHKLQLAVFLAEERKTYGAKHDPRSIRDAMKMKTLPAGCAQAVYIGIDAYLTAGGRIEREMFMGSEGDERIVDVQLLDKLAREKMAADIPKVAKKDGFGAAVSTQGLGSYPAWPKVPEGMERDSTWRLDPAKLSKEEKAASTAVYRLAEDGSGPVFEGRFRPTRAPEPGRDLVGERRDHQRREAVLTRAAIFALPDLTGTPLDGMLVADEDGYLTCDDDDETVFWLNVRVKLTAEQLEAHRAEAEDAIARQEVEDAAVLAGPQAEAA